MPEIFCSSVVVSVKIIHSSQQCELKMKSCLMATISRTEFACSVMWNYSAHGCQYRMVVDEEVENWEFERCSNSNGLVVSQVLSLFSSFLAPIYQVFCLPVDYRKDVLPPCKLDQSFSKKS